MARRRAGDWRLGGFGDARRLGDLWPEPSVPGGSPKRSHRPQVICRAANRSLSGSSLEAPARWNATARGIRSCGHDRSSDRNLSDGTSWTAVGPLDPRCRGRSASSRPVGTRPSPYAGRRRRVLQRRARQGPLPGTGLLGSPALAAHDARVDVGLLAGQRPSQSPDCVRAAAPWHPRIRVHPTRARGPPRRAPTEA